MIKPQTPDRARDVGFVRLELGSLEFLLNFELWICSFATAR